jgi:hypothetical protein
MRKQIQNFSTNINRTYCVSTAFRESSCFEFPVKYYETFVWTLDKDGKLDKIIHQSDGGYFFDNAYQDHMRLVKIFRYLVERKLR